MGEPELKLLVERVISTWRTLHNRLNPEQQKIRIKPYYFAAPLQIEVFRFFNQPLDVSVQLWVFSQFEHRADKEIICHNIETTNVERQLAKILDDSRFNWYLEDSQRFTLVDETITVRQAVAEACESALRKLRGDLLGTIWGGPGYGMRAGGGYPSEKMWYWMFTNDPTFEDIKADITDSIEQARRTQPVASTRETEVQRVPKERKYDLLGSYLYPPVWIGERPKPSVQQLLVSGIYGYDYQSGPFTKIVCEHEIHRARLVSTQDGLIAMSTEDKRLFLDTFNVLVAILNLNGYEFLTLRENELMCLDYFIVQKGEIHPSLYESNKARLSPWIYRNFLTPVVSMESLRQSFQLSELITSTNSLNGLFIIFAEASSHFLQEEYSQSVLWGWILVERWVFLKWEEYLTAQGVSNKISRALNEVDISRNLRVLGKLGILETSTKQQLEKLRNIRNKIAHRGYLATKQEADETINICKEFLLSLFKAP